MKLLLQLLAIFRAMHWAHWTAHWKTRGEPFYGDHLLFQRLYEGLAGEVDALAEKIVGTYGSEAVMDMAVLADTTRFINQYPEDEPGALYTRALAMEVHLQQALKMTYDSLKASGDLSLGMDDWLMATASAHETNLYLLQQRMGVMAVKVASRGLPR
jgi:DNA-binding ferritin-like protein